MTDKMAAAVDVDKVLEEQIEKVRGQISEALSDGDGHVAVTKYKLLKYLIGERTPYV